MRGWSIKQQILVLVLVPTLIISLLLGGYCLVIIEYGNPILESLSTKVIAENHQILFHIGIILLLGLCMSILHALQLGRYLATPVQQLIDTVTQLKKGQWDKSKFQTQAGAGAHAQFREFQLLNADIQSMADSLKNNHLQMQLQIDNATINLRRTLETIEIQNIELDIAREKAEHTSQVKSAFLADMSHEIRTPLNGVIGFTNLLQKTELNAKQQDYLSTIQKSAKNLLSIINDILDFSKIEAGKLRIDRTSLDIRECLDEILTLLEPEAHNKNVVLIPLVYANVPKEVLGDPLRIKQVITNLLSNAIKFTEKGSVVVRISMDNPQNNLENPQNNSENPQNNLDNSQNNKELRLKVTVTDTGIGLSKEDAADLFKPYHQAAGLETTRKFGGTGLGLVICKKLVEYMQGHIGVDSELGKGSTFWFTFVVEKMEELTLSHQQQNSSQDIPENFANLNSSIHILAVDDNLENLKLIQALLEDMGLRVTAVNSGESALIEFEQSKKFDMVLMDIRMPNMNGIETTIAIRNLEKQRNLLFTPIVALTAHALVTEREAVLSAGFNGYLTKPLDEKELYHQIKKWTDKVIDPEEKNPKKSAAGKEPELKIVDWELALKLAGGKEDLAQDLFERLKKSLGDDKIKINQAFETRNLEALRDQVHRVHGASCYCGVPRLKQAAHTLESSIGMKTWNVISEQLDVLNTEIDNILGAEVIGISA